MITLKNYETSEEITPLNTGPAVDLPAVGDTILIDEATVYQVKERRFIYQDRRLREVMLFVLKICQL